MKRLAAPLAFLACLVSPLAGAMEMPQPWASTHGLDNPLVGTVWTGAGAGADLGDVAKAAAGARFVLIGETHTNPDHHRIQAALLSSLVASGARPAVVFEMISADMAPALSAYLARPDASVGGFGAAMRWSERGWPDFSIYAPVVKAAMAAKLPIFAGDLAPEALRRIGKGGVTPDETRRLGLDLALPEASRLELSAILEASHCGMLPARAVAPMLNVQRARDGALADALVEAAGEGGTAVLIAGAGHARRDFAVPAVLAAKVPGAKTVSIGLMEVEAGESDPAAYGLKGAGGALYDYVMFTPRADVSDPCEGMAEAMRPR